MIPARINRIYFPVQTLGYGKRLGVWMQGCPRRCKNCMSPEMQPINGPRCDVTQVLEMFPADLPADGLTISGGEPFDQPAAVAAIVRWFIQHYGDDVLVYTGYTIEQLQAKQDPDVSWLLEHIAVLVDGPYVDELNTGRGAVGSSNQRVHVFRYNQRYSTFTQSERKMQSIQEDGELFFIGVLPKQNTGAEPMPRQSGGDAEEPQ